MESTSAATTASNSARYWRYDDEDLDINSRIGMTVGEDVDDDDDDEILDMDFESAADDTFDESYQAKCGAHTRHRWKVCSGEAEEAGDELSESDRKLVQAAIGSVRADHIQCNCFNARCKIVRYLKKSHQASLSTCQIQRNDSCSSQSSSTARLQIAKDDFRRTHEDLVTLAGGKEKAAKVYEHISRLANGQTRINSKAACNTALMQLCSTTFKDESDPTRSGERSMLYAQIYAIIKLYMDLDPEALFVRNSQDAGALELAALTNKVVVSKYLLMLHTIYGRDVNAPNQRGHTLLHLLARKGDDCADAIEALLGVKVVSCDGSASQRLLRMDVLNEGKKTPLDVATACVDLFSCGKDRTLYTRVISIFHSAIEEEARQLVSDTQKRSSSLTFRNAF